MNISDEIKRLLHCPFKFYKQFFNQIHYWNVKFLQDANQVNKNILRIGLFMLDNYYCKMDLDISFIGINSKIIQSNSLTIWPFLLPSLIGWFKDNNVLDDYEKFEMENLDETFHKILKSENFSDHKNMMTKYDEEAIIHFQKKFSFLINEKFITLRKLNGKSIYFSTNEEINHIKRKLEQKWCEFRYKKRIIRELAIITDTKSYNNHLEEINEEFSGVKASINCLNVTKLISNYII